MAQQAFYTKINAGAGVQFSGGTVAQATAVLHTNNVLYLRGGSGGLFLQNSDGSDGIFVANDHVEIQTASAERMRIDSLGQVGIGDQAPTIISANTFSLSVNSARNDLSGALISKANGTIKHQQYWDSSGYIFSLSASSGDFKWKVNNSEKMRLTSTGRVGIGTDSPGMMLHVKGGDEATMKLESTSGEPAIFWAPGSSSLKWEQRASASRWQLYQYDEAEWVFNIYDAKVGIGTVSPIEKLHVYNGGDARVEVEGTTGVAGLKATNNQGSFAWYIPNDADNFRLYDFTDNADRITIDGSGKTTFNAYGSGSFTGTAAYNLQVDSSGNIIETAAGGSGTVTGSGTIGYIPKWTGSSALGNSVLQNDSSLPNDLIMPQYIRHSGDTNAYFGFYTTDTFIVSTAGNERMRVNSAGNVGIGTNSPTAKLHVEGNLELQASWEIGSNDGSYWQRIRTVDSSSATAQAFNFETRNGSGSFINHMTILNDGNVGIGIVPVAKLHVYQNDSADDTTAGVTIEQDGTGDAALSFLLTGTRRWRLGIDNNDSDKFKISDSTNLAASNKLTIDTSGNVGIGTSNPSTTLDVAGILRIAESGNTAFYGGDYVRLFGTQAFRFLNSSGSSIAQVSLTGNSYFNGGNLGINQSNPRAKLEVYNTAVTSDADYSATETLSGQDSIVLYSTGTAENTYGSITWATGDRRRAMITAVAESSDSDYQGIAFYTQGTDGSGDFYESMRIKHSGQISFYDYRGTSNTGTPTYLLGTDANGLMVKTNSSSHLPGGPYLPLAGGTMTGDINFNDGIEARFGNSQDLTIQSVGDEGYIQNYTGNLNIVQNANDSDIIFKSDDGSGGTTTYFYLDGSGALTRVSRNFRADDSIKFQVGSSGDFNMFHNGTDSYLENDTGDLYIRNNVNDKDIILQSDNGSGGITEYIRLDGSEARININAPNGMQFMDNVKAKFGTSGDLEIYHDGNNSFIKDVGTGVLSLQGNIVVIENTNGANMLLGVAGAQAQLYYNGVSKLETTSAGIAVTGNVAASGNGTFGPAGTGTTDAIVSIDGGSGTGGEAYLRLTRGGTSGFILNHTASNIQVRTTANIPTIFYTNDTVALTLDTSQNATFAGNVLIPNNLQHVNDDNNEISFGTDTQDFRTNNVSRLDISNSGVRFGGGGATVTTILDEDTMSSNSATALATQQSIKAYVDTSITGSTTFRGTWDPDVSLNSGYGNPNLNTVTKQDGYYYICSANGAATPNGTGTEPDSWHTGDWVVYNSNLTGGAAWQKIDNTSVISGAGTGQKVVKWDGSGTSETIADGPITFSSDDSTFAGDITMNSASSPTLTITDTSQTTTLKAFAQDSNAHIGTFSSHPFIINSNGATALTIDTSQDALFSSDVAVTAKLAVGTTSVHGSYDLYNQGTFYSNGAATINANLTVDAGSISITADGSNAATLTESGGGDFTIAAVDDIRLDSGGEIILDSATAEIHLKVSGGIFGKFFRSGGNFYINSPAENADIYFSGNDDGSAVNALRLDMSDSGWAHFNTGIAVGNASATSTFAGNVNIAVGKKLYFGGGSHTYIGEDIDDRLRLFVGGAEFLRFTEDTADTIFICQNAKPLSDSAIDLGSTSLRYANIWVDNINGGTPTTGGPYLPLTGGTMTGSLIIDGEGSSSDVLKLKGSARIQLENANATDSFYISNTGGNAASVLDLGGSLSLIENGNATFTGSVGVGVTGGSNAKLEVVSTSGEVFRADSSGGAFRIVATQTGVNTQGVLAHTGNSTFTGTLQWGGGKGLLTYGSDRAILRADQLIEFQTNATSSPTAALILDTNQNATFAGDVTINGSHLVLANGTTEAQTTDYLYIGGDGLASADAAIYIGNGGSGDNVGWRLYYEGSGSGNDNKFIIKSENTGSPVDALAFTQDGNATFAGDVTVGDELTITTINNATADPDKFLCASGANKVGYRTGAQVLSDIGAAPATGGAYLPLAGGTMTGTTKHGDDVVSYWGTGDDLEIYHNSSGDSVIQNHVGDLLFLQKADAKDITFKSDNGSGGLTEYFRIDGSGEYLLVSADLGMYFNDGIAARFGNSGDLHLSHSGTESVIANEVGNLYISQRANNSNIIFESDDSTGGLATYFQVDGANHRVKFSKDSVHTDNVKALFGDSLDVQIYHNSTDSYIENYTGNFTIRQRQDTGDISFESDDGSGGTTQYFRIDGGIESLVASKDLLMAIDGDGGKLKFGASQDLQIYHQGANSFIDEVGTGNLYIRAATNMFFQTYGSGERWITLTENAGVELFHNDLPALQTNNDGIAITGSIILNGAGVGNCGERYIRYNCPDDSVYNVIGITTGGVDIPGTLGVSGIVTLNNNLRLQDSDKIQIGNSQDLEIYHSSGRSYIDNDTGHLYIRNNVDNDDGSNIYIQAKSGENSIICNDDSSVTLYYNNSVKFYTHGSGVGSAGYYGFGSAGTSTGSSYYFRYGSQAAGATQGLIITTSDTGGSYFDGVAQFRNTNTGQGANMFQMINYGSLYGRYMNFYRGSTSNIIGYIGYNATNTAVTYSTSSSDIRLKKNIVDWSEDVLPKFLALTPKKFDFKAAIGDKGAAKVKGFIAQYETENFPEVYQLNGEGQDARYGFHPMEMVPYLMKAVKELAQKNEDLERRLAALEK